MTCVDYNAWKKDENYREIITEDFNLLTPENVLKWNFIRPEEGKFDFSKPDDLIDFAKKNDMSVTDMH